MKPTALVVLRQPVYRDAVAGLLDRLRLFQTVGTAGGGIDAIQFASVNDRVDFVILDARLHGLTGHRVARALRRGNPSVRVLLLVPDLSDESIVDAIRAGVDAVLPQAADEQALLELVGRVLRGDQPMNELLMQRPMLAIQVFSMLRPGQGPEGIDLTFDALTLREVAIVDGVVQGMTNREIGDRLCVTEQTVKNHMTGVLRKMRADDRVEVVRHAVKQGWAQFGPRQPAKRAPERGAAVVSAAD